ncbi:2-amino-4-hydroxy-6-hydroxymethyldihydropteridine pyrophosphokinase [Rhodoferax ferrireducens T118]|uniref:2-amino-4-hydroxy-6-hydroxymethyldihydropteridine pyrophosphokinase n=1 Tax=Albidiferax ferrireducens (strain ATCC BAA-621 / DSM 15236 / T118) TaxID=338969 RepID=Q21VH8_ALBFT|nr:2-amino-4-hydroxy-6-hydroxymethyldihydropteridine pyrophosphokinase [Rhodoferax ferrireducens T118]
MSGLVRDPITAYIALGANLGDARAAVLRAMRVIAALPATTLVRRSSLYRTAPVEAMGPDYINAVVEVATGLHPLELLLELQQLEQAAGRERPYRNASRTLDLDILLYGEASMDSPTLVIPHPRMMARAFVLVPLAEIAPLRVSSDQLRAVSDQAVKLVTDC